MSISMVEFIYSDDVTVINRAQFEAHMRLYKGYIDKYNEIEAELTSNGDRKNANATYSKFRGLKRGESYTLNGVILHELYFENIGSEMQKNPTAVMQNWINTAFLSYANWRDDFIATAKASRGWVIMAYEQRTKSLMNISLDAHNEGNIALSYPLLVLDMYEHAYFLEYADNKGQYIENFMNDINWEVVGCRLSKLTS